MGISASCQPSYPQYKDFVLLIQNANNIIKKDKNIWSSCEKIVLQNFFENLELTLQNTQIYNLQLPWGNSGTNWSKSDLLKEYFNHIRLIIPKSKKLSKLFAFAHPGEVFSQLLPNTQNQFAQVYGIIIFLWLMFDDGSNAVKYFYQTDILHHIYVNDYKSIEIMMNALEKIYFTSKDGYIPSECLIIPTCGFRLIQGKLKSFFENNVINAPKTYKVIPNSEMINEPFYTITSIQIEIFLTEKPIHPKKKSDLNQIQEDIEFLIKQFKGKKGFLSEKMLFDI